CSPPGRRAGTGGSLRPLPPTWRGSLPSARHLPGGNWASKLRLDAINLSGSKSRTDQESEQLLELVVDHRVEPLDALRDLVGAGLGQAAGSETLDRNRRHRGAACQRLTEGAAVGSTAARQPPEEAAGERVSGPGGIAQHLHRERRRDERLLPRVVERAV